jgi:hypothetical protein
MHQKKPSYPGHNRSANVAISSANVARKIFLLYEPFL